VELLVELLAPPEVLEAASLDSWARPRALPVELLLAVLLARPLALLVELPRLVELLARARLLAELLISSVDSLARARALLARQRVRSSSAYLMLDFFVLTYTS
jgi:hypothetical protein